MKIEWTIIAFGVVPLMIAIIYSWWMQSEMNKSNKKIIQAQQDTIQKLLNREPVTYAEVGAKPVKKSTERYAAWGSQMVDLDETERS